MFALLSEENYKTKGNMTIHDLENPMNKRFLNIFIKYFL